MMFIKNKISLGFVQGYLVFCDYGVNNQKFGN